MRYVGFVALAAALVGGTLLAQTGPGVQRGRPGEGRAPEFPPPTIVDYKPRTTLKVAEHKVPKAKFPVVDIHSHQPTPITPEQFDKVVQGMDANNLRVLINLSGGYGDRLRQGLDAIAKSPHKDRMVLFANVNFEGVGTPGWSQKAAAQLEGDIKAGARGLKIFKDLGLRIRKADGSRLKVDDPDLDPVWDVCGRLGVPVLIHTAEPQEFFEPIDVKNERWLELALFNDRRYPAGEFPRFEELLAERDRMFRKHPEDHLHRCALRLSRQRSGEGAGDARHDAERPPRGGGHSRRARPPAEGGARLLREEPEPRAVRQGQLPARRVSRTIGGRSRPATSTSTTTATITPSGSCTGCRCQTRC